MVAILAHFLAIVVLVVVEILALVVDLHCVWLLSLERGQVVRVGVAADEIVGVRGSSYVVLRQSRQPPQL